MTLPASEQKLGEQKPWPLDLTFDRQHSLLLVAYEDATVLEIPFELLRVESPSAEVQGHGGRKVIVKDKASVGVTDAVPVGRYAVRIVFDDGHSTGIYSWEYLRHLGQQKEELLAKYRASLAG
jgi:DUF971 family protein